jgi:hypothetical protein
MYKKQGIKNSLNLMSNPSYREDPPEFPYIFHERWIFLRKTGQYMYTIFMPTFHPRKGDCERSL